jgi:hypothetical protein
VYSLLDHRDVAEGTPGRVRIASLFGFEGQVGAEFPLEVIVAVWAVPASMVDILPS